MKTNCRLDLAWRSVEVTDPIAWDLSAILSRESEAYLVSALEFALEAGEHKVLGARRRTTGHSNRFL
jgi:hypothetical protein